MLQQNNAGNRSTQVNGYQVVMQLSVPVYQGSAEYSAVRQAKQQQQTSRLVDDVRRTAVQNAVQAWETLVAARAAADSNDGPDHLIRSPDAARRVRLSRLGSSGRRRSGVR